MLGNILEQEDIVKGLPDDYLYAEAEQPSGQLPPFLVVSEIQRRTDMRERYEATQDQPQGTITQQIVAEGLGGMSPMDMASQTMGSPIPTDPTSPVPVVAATGAFPDGAMAIGDSGLAGMGGQPQMVASGGVVGMANGGGFGSYPYEVGDPNYNPYYDPASDVYGTAEPLSYTFRGVGPWMDRNRERSLKLRELTEQIKYEEGVGFTEARSKANAILDMEEGEEPLDSLDVDSQDALFDSLSSEEVDDTVDVDVGNIADIADQLQREAQFIGSPIEDEILSVGDRLGKDYGKDLPYGTGVEDQQALKTDRARGYLDEMETLTAEDVAAEESIVADYRDRIERSQQQARDDAFNAWLGHFGAGVAGGDLQGGLERGTGAIGDIKKESRATTLALEEGIVASERSRRKTAVDALKSMADIDVNFLKLANEVSRENGLMDRSDDDKQIALMNLIGDLMPDTTIATPSEIETNLTTMFNAVSHLFGLPQVSTTGGSGGGVGTDPVNRPPLTDFN